MKKQILILFAALFLNGALFSQTMVGGVSLPDKLGFNQTVRHYTGAGIREKFFVRVYVLGLYMKNVSTNPQEIIKADAPMSIRIQITSAMLTGETMVRYIREGFARSTSGNSAQFKNKIDMICTIFTAEPTKVGDVYDIHYTPGIGISASKNAKEFDFDADAKRLNVKINHSKNGQSALPTLEFKRAVYGIWFSNDPVDPVLKEQVLGGK